MESEATLHIIEDEDGQVQVYVDLSPELTEEQRTGQEDLLFPQYIAGVLVEAIGQSLERLGMERLELPDESSDAQLHLRAESEDSDTTLH
jgi:hypothetical protein